MKIAITGHDGFLGTFVKDKVSRSNELILFGKKNSLFDVDSLKSLVLDVDIVIHLAGVNRDTESNFVKVNTFGTSVLLEAMKMWAPHSRIIFASTYQVYYESGMYGLSKKCAEEIIQEFSKHTNIKGTILRISNIYGPGGKPFYNSVVATFAHLVQHNKPLLINGDGSSKRDYIYIDDVVTAISQSVKYKQKKPFEVFNIGSGRATSLKTIVSIIEKLSTKKVKVRYNKAGTKDPGLIIKSISKAKNSLQWDPKITMNQGLEKILREF